MISNYLDAVCGSKFENWRWGGRKQKVNKVEAAKLTTHASASTHVLMSPFWL